MVVDTVFVAVTLSSTDVCSENVLIDVSRVLRVVSVTVVSELVIFSTFVTSLIMVDVSVDCFREGVVEKSDGKIVNSSDSVKLESIPKVTESIKLSSTIIGIVKTLSSDGKLVNSSMSASNVTLEPMLRVTGSVKLSSTIIGIVNESAVVLYSAVAEVDDRISVVLAESMRI